MKTIDEFVDFCGQNCIKLSIEIQSDSYKKDKSFLTKCDKLEFKDHEYDNPHFVLRSFKIRRNCTINDVEDIIKEYKKWESGEFDYYDN